MTVFSIDTSALVGAWTESYSPRTFPGLWKNVEAMIENGTLVASEEVLHELRRQDDDLFAWTKTQSGLFVPMDAQTEDAVKRVVQVPNLVRGTSTDNSADPFVIAVALARGGTVVSQERNGGPAHPKIPYVCRTLGIPHQSLQEFVNGQGWTFG